MPEGPQGSFKDSGDAKNMIKQTLILAMLPVAVSAGAACMTDPPEMGDIGPGSEVVCDGLEREFPGPRWPSRVDPSTRPLWSR